MSQLSWDLHIHPAPSAAPRWGDGLQIWEAARNAGVRGFVWKSHEEHTAQRCLALPPGPPTAIGSASLNAWASLESVMGALALGARWIWGPSRDAEGGLAWDLSLPRWWPELRATLATLSHAVILATSHLDAAGRLEFARTAAERPNVRCSVTHSLYLPAEEAGSLSELGCAFEFDFYTAVHPVPGRPPGDLLVQAASLRDAGSFVYFTSDSTRLLSELAASSDNGLIDEVAVRNPAELVGTVLPVEVAR